MLDLGWRHLRSLPNCPQTNGFVERFHRTMKDELRNHDQFNLDILDEVVTKYNTKPHTLTKYSPFYLWELLLLKYYNGAENDKESIVSLYFEIKENLDKYQSNYVNYQNRKRKYAIKIG